MGWLKLSDATKIGCVRERELKRGNSSISNDSNDVHVVILKNRYFRMVMYACYRVLWFCDIFSLATRMLGLGPRHGDGPAHVIDYGHGQQHDESRDERSEHSRLALSLCCHLLLCQMVLFEFSCRVVPEYGSSSSSSQNFDWIFGCGQIYKKVLCYRTKCLSWYFWSAVVNWLKSVKKQMPWLSSSSAGFMFETNLMWANVLLNEVLSVS